MLGFSAMAWVLFLLVYNFPPREESNIQKNRGFLALACAFLLTPNFFPLLDKGKKSGLKIRWGPKISPNQQKETDVFSFWLVSKNPKEVIPYVKNIY